MLFRVRGYEVLSEPSEPSGTLGFFIRNLALLLMGLTRIHLSSKHYTTGTFSDVCSSCCHFTHGRRTSILNQCTLLTRKLAKSVGRGALRIGCGICRINFLPARQLCHWFVHATRLTWTLFQEMSMPHHSISQLVRFEKKSTGHLHSVPDFSLGRYPVPQKLTEILMRHGITRLEQCSPSSRICDTTGPGLKWNRTDGFHRQCYPLLVAWVRDCPEVMLAQVSYVPCLLCEVPKGELMGHSTFRPLDNSRDQHVWWLLLDDSDLDVLYTLGVDPIQNEFWLYPPCNVHWLW